MSVDTGTMPQAARDGARAARDEASARGSFSLSQFARGGSGVDGVRSAVDAVASRVGESSPFLASIDKSLREKRGLIVGA